MEKNYAKIVAMLMRQIKTKLEKTMRAQFNDNSLTFTQLTVLGLLHHSDGMKMSDISLKMGLNNSTISGIIDRLEKMNLVKRLRTEDDRRVVNVQLSDNAADFKNCFEKKLEESFSNFFKKASYKDMEIIITGLEKLNQVLGDFDLES